MPRYKIMPSLFQRLVWGPIRCVLWLFADLKINGAENLNTVRGNMIIASNHTNQLDPLLIVARVLLAGRILIAVVALASLPGFVTAIADILQPPLTSIPDSSRGAVS